MSECTTYHFSAGTVECVNPVFISEHLHIQLAPTQFIVVLLKRLRAALARQKELKSAEGRTAPLLLTLGKLTEELYAPYFCREGIRYF
jgi:hypothetical protein